MGSDSPTDRLNRKSCTAQQHGSEKGGRRRWTDLPWLRARAGAEAASAGLKLSGTGDELEESGALEGSLGTAAGESESHVRLTSSNKSTSQGESYIWARRGEISAHPARPIVVHSFLRDKGMTDPNEVTYPIV